jgi:hypothetical protein
VSFLSIVFMGLGGEMGDGSWELGVTSG